MDKRNLDNKTLDAIGRRLIESEGRRSSDIEEIISNPDLFDLVNAGIAANAKMTYPETVRAFPFGRPGAIALAGVAIMILAIGMEGLLRSERSLFAAKQVQVPEPGPDAARPEFPPEPLVRKLSAGRAFNLQTRAEKAMAGPDRKKARQKFQTRTRHEPEADFYAVSYTGDPDEATGGSRIVRVDMSRSSLFALGVNVPLENDAQIVKADLLIGSDGMTRAIRVVD